MLGKVYYRKELQNTYIIEAECKKDIIESFTGKMVLMGKIENIASCSTQLMDGKREVRFDVSSMESLDQFFAVKDIDYETLSSLILKIGALMDDMERHLLDGNGICFEPQYIFWDRGKGNFKFLYDYTEIHEKSRIIDLAEYCLERINNKEDQAVDLAYYLYEHARGNHFSLKEVEEYLEKKEKDKNEKKQRGIKEKGNEEGGENTCTDDNHNGNDSYIRDKNIKENHIKDDSITDAHIPDHYIGDEMGYGNISREEQEYFGIQNDYSEGYTEKTLKGRSTKKKGGKNNHHIPMEEKGLKIKKLQEMELRVPQTRNIDQEKKSKPVLVIAGIALLAASAISLVLYNYLSVSFSFNTVIEIAWMGASVVLAIIGVTFFIIHKRKEGREDSFDGEEDIMQDLAVTEEESFYFKNKTVSPKEEELWAHMVDNSRKLESREQYKFDGQDLSGDTNGNSRINMGQQGTGGAYTNGKTVYVGREEAAEDHSLIGRHRGRDREYPIGRYPWIIGKEKEHVNMEIKEPSVSRIHARITCDEGNFFLEDLASTNGTYLNDLPLAPHEKIRIKRGDIILFGRSEFVFE